MENNKMKRNSFVGLGALAILLCAPFTSPRADTVPGWYLGAGVIGSQPVHSDTSDIAGVTNKVEYDFGWGVMADLGYAWHNGIRLEEEFAYSRSNVNKVNGTTESSGRINNLDLMTNLLYDFQTGTRWTPYIGAGMGAAAVDADHIGTLTNGGSLNDSDMEFAYQGIAGIAYELSDHWSVQADYRFVGTTEPTFKTTAGGSASIENMSHNIVLSVRYTMHPPPPPAPQLVQTAAPMVAPPPPAPAVQPPVVPQRYMVFFDFDKSTLTPEAKNILASAAAEYKRNGYVRIDVTGHTDTMGTGSYNQALSERRAAAVKAELVRLGLDPNSIDAVGVGKNGLMVPTADQIREAQNRRAEIVLSK
jgi:outer membrane protein OmpA-like peptidoglycan-associated protein